MNIQQTPLFERTVKKLTKQQKKDVDNAVITVWNNPDIGEAKVGDLAGVFVYKFNYNDGKSKLYVIDTLKVTSLDSKDNKELGSLLYNLENSH